MEKETLYQKLIKAVEELPKEAVETAKKEITRKGYDTTGYQYQFLVNILNEVVGIGNWGFDYQIIKEQTGAWSNGKGYWEITTDVKVWIMEGEKKIEFKCAGGHKSEMHADAVKGAITNGFKKTIAFFGIGKKAYEGTIDDDYRPIPQNTTKQQDPIAQQLHTKLDFYQQCESAKKGELRCLQCASPIIYYESKTGEAKLKCEKDWKHKRWISKAEAEIIKKGDKPF